MLGNPGSNPLELFWDAVDTLDQKLDAKLTVVEDAIKRHNERLPSSADQQGEGDTNKGFKVAPNTTKEEFLAVMKANSNEAVQKLRRDDLDEIYKTVRITFVFEMVLIIDTGFSCTIRLSKFKLTRNGARKGDSGTSRTISVTLLKRWPIPLISTYHTRR